MHKGKWLIGALVLVLAAAGIWWQQNRGVEARLLGFTPYRILKQHEPGEYRTVLAAYRGMRAGKVTSSQFVNLANSSFNAAATRRFATASPQSVQALMTDTLVTVKKLQRHSPESCFRYFFPEVSGPPDVAQVLSADEQRRTLELLGEVIRSSAETPSPAPDPERVKDVLANIVNGVYEQFGSDAQMVAHAADPRVDRAKICTITLTLYDRIMALPADTGIQLMRILAAS